MPAYGRLVPNENSRQKHSILGTVVEHVNRTTGWWFRKTTVPGIKVRFSAAEHRRYASILQEADELALYPPDYVEVGFPTSAERDEFIIGETVDVQFSTSTPLEKFFTGAQPFQWENIQKARTTAEV